MEQRTIKARRVAQVTAGLVREAALSLPGPVVRLVDRAILREKSPAARQALGAIKANDRLARHLGLPLCQDTGLVEVFVELGNRVAVDLQKFRTLEAVISAGIAAACRDYYLRASVVDPLSRENTGDNAPGVVHVRLVAGREMRLTVMLKGFGSENVGCVANLAPGSEAADIVSFVVSCVRRAGADSCPPVIVGCGIGGTMEKAALMAREVLLSTEKLDRANPDRALNRMEKEILRAINRFGVGPAGLGGLTTALAVKVGRHPTHIAGLPVAVNISCWALRVACAEVA